MAVKFGKLSPLEFFGPDSNGSHRKIECVCDCGRTKVSEIRRLVSGRTSSCGACNEITADEIRTRQFGKLKLSVPINIKPGSNQKLIWLCQCGRDTLVSPNQVISGKTTSCGRCNNISAAEMALKKFGKLRIAKPIEISPSSSKIVEWTCDCGKSVKSHVKSVVQGLRKSCSACNEILAPDLKKAQFGSLRLKTPTNLKVGSAKKVVWICSCGNETVATINHVLSGHTKSCGKCWGRILTEFEVVKDELRKLRTPINPEDMDFGFIKPLETVTNVGVPFQAICPVCYNKYAPRWESIRLGKGLTCGCVTSRVSSGHRELTEFLRSLNLEVVQEFKIDKFSYDLMIPSKNLLVEFNGLFWHSKPASRKRDYEKYELAIKSGYNFVSLFEDEWEFSREKIESLLKNKLGLNKPRSLRPSQCQIKEILASEADRFLDKFHYIGGSKAPINYGFFHENELIGCMSFKRPTRQSSHEWELSRMSSSPPFRVHGIWSILLKRFVQTHHPKSIVSFSENRLFDGKVYEKIGFKRDAELPPDYWWTKGKRRFHKSGLRKKPNETGTEIELRMSEGYRRIWDLGKIRWVY